MNAIPAVQLYPAVLTRSLGCAPLQTGPSPLTSHVAPLLESSDYSFLSTWDTYRAWGPLMCKLMPRVMLDIVRTSLLHHSIVGVLPRWTYAGKETSCMPGIHSMTLMWQAVSECAPLLYATVCEHGLRYEINLTGCIFAQLFAPRPGPLTGFSRPNYA